MVRHMGYAHETTRSWVDPADYIATDNGQYKTTLWPTDYAPDSYFVDASGRLWITVIEARESGRLPKTRPPICGVCGKNAEAGYLTGHKGTKFRCLACVHVVTQEPSR